MPSPPEVMSESQRQRMALAALEHFGWNQGDAAHAIGWRRETLNRKLKEWGGPDGLRRSVKAQPSQESQGSHWSQRSHVIDGNRTPGFAVPASVSAALTSVDPARRLGTVEAEAQEMTSVRIPPISVEFDAEEDLFISQEVAKGRLTGGARTRTAVIRMALRELMLRRRREAEEQTR